MVQFITRTCTRAHTHTQSLVESRVAQLLEGQPRPRCSAAKGTSGHLCNDNHFGH